VAGPGFPLCTHEGTIGWAVTLVGGQNDTDNNFGNWVPPLVCQKPTAIAIMNEAFPGNAGPDITVKTWLGESVQAAVDNATDLNGDHYVIIFVIAHADGSLGGTAVQKVVISKDYTATAASNYPFGLIGCSVTMTGGGSDPAVWIKDTAKGKLTTINGHSTNILVADLHGGNSAVGVEADGTLRYLRNEGASNNGTGIKVLGNNNTVHNGAANGNTGDGVSVTGSFNYLTDTNSMGNSGNGFNVVGSSNQLLKLDAGEKTTPNSLDGVHVVGNSNKLSEIDAYANSGDGIDVAGNSNTLSKNVAGDKNKGNTGSGIRVQGSSNSLTENKANANTGDGFTIGGTPANLLKNNKSNTTSSGGSLENGGPEYRFLNPITNQGGNQKDNVNFTATAAGAYE
jgi:parallel beta-helix repeat protein